MQKTGPRGRISGLPALWRAALACCLALALLAGCAPAAGGTAGADAAQKAEPRPGEGTEAAEPAEAGPLELGTAWYAFRAEIAGTVLAFPCPASRLKALGWRLPAEAGGSLAPGEYADLTVDTGAGLARLRLANTGQAAKPLEDCALAGVLLGQDAEGAALAAVPGGVGPGSSRAEVLQAWGMPDDGAGEGQTLRYTAGRKAHAQLELDGDKVKNLELVCYQAAAAPPRAEALPPKAAAYTPPAELGGDLWSYNMLYGQALYTLPAPVAAFLQNGWVLRDAGTIAPGGFMMGVSLVLGNQCLRTTLYNFEDDEQPLEHCFVVTVESSTTSVRVPLQLPGGLGSHSSYQEVLALMGPTTDIAETINAYTLTYHAPNGAGRLLFSFTPDEERTLFDVELWHTELA